MAISSPGLGSNLDVNSIISQLMSLEQRPLVALSRKEASFQSKISAIGSLKSVLSALNSAAAGLVPGSTQTATEKFTTYRSTIADATIASVSTTAAAVAGTYTIAVSQLAKAQRLESAVNPTISDGTLTIAIGSYTPAGAPTTFTPKPGTSAVDITIDTSNNTIEGVRDAINAAKAGVTATVVNGVNGKQLIVESNTTGTDSAIRISGSTGFVFDPTEVTPDTLTETVLAQNAALKINGIDISSQSNTVSTAIEGITLNLLKGPEAPALEVSTTLTIARDNGSLTAQLNALIKSYNDANKAMKELGSYDAATKKAGALNGDSTLRSAQAQVRGVLNNVPAGLSGTYQRLADIGISVGLDGNMSLDSSKLTTALTADFSGVANLVAAYGTAFKTATEALVGTTGTLVSRTEGLNQSIKLLEKQADALANRLERTEARLRRQFTALDTLISGLTKTSSFLQQQLANLPTTGS